MRPTQGQGDLLLPADFGESDMTDNIIDVSRWEQPIDFGKVAASGIIAVVAKATQGAAGVDEAYGKFKAEAAPCNFLWGSYHFGTSDEVTSQVDHYIRTVHPDD